MIKKILLLLLFFFSCKKEIIKENILDYINKDYDTFLKKSITLLKDKIEIQDFSYERYIKLINLEKNNPNSYLLMSAFLGRIDLVKYIIKNLNVNLSYKDDENMTALHYAMFSKNLELIKYLIQKHISLDSKTDFGSNYLLVAAQINDIEIFKYIYSLGLFNIRDTDYNWRTSLHHASIFNNIELIEYILSIDSSLLETQDKYGMSSFLLSVKNGSILACKTLLDKGADPYLKNKIQQDALLLSIENSQINLMEFLINKYNFKLNKKDIYKRDSFLISLMNLKLNDIKYLIKNTNTDIKELINEKDISGYTALMYSLFNNKSKDIFDYLMKNQADPYAITEDNENVLDLALTLRKYYIIRPYIKLFKLDKKNVKSL